MNTQTRASALRARFKLDKECLFIGVNYASITFLGYPKQGLSTKEYRVKVCLVPCVVLFITWSRSSPTKIDPRLAGKLKEWQEAS